jgi:dihydroorotase
MKRFLLLIFLVSLANISVSWSQSYDIIVKGGHVIDPKNQIDEKMDVGIKDGKISLVAKSIDPGQAIQIVNASGHYVIPGIIDMHTHNFFGTEPGNYLRNSFYALPPDGFTFRTGVTTVVDTGSAGWKSFPTFKEQTIDRAQTRVLAFLHILGEGMRGGAWAQNLGDMDARQTAITARRYRDHIVGIKVAHYAYPEWTPIDRAIEASSMAGNIPVMIDFGSMGFSLEELVMDKLRPGDIYSHTYGGGGQGRESIIDPETGRLRPFVKDAQKRGIIWEVGFGGASFFYDHAIPAIGEGFYPDVISTDLHGGSMNTAMKDILNVMGSFIALGMDLNDVIEAVTWKPARVINREELGHLSAGAEGDLTVLRIRKGEFGFFDPRFRKIKGDTRFECEVTIKAGRVAYDLNGLSEPILPFPVSR